MDHAAYLALEATGEDRHDYLRGEVWAMAGGTHEHARLAAALTLPRRDRGVRRHGPRTR
jgi:hypothetical protein